MFRKTLHERLAQRVRAGFTTAAETGLATVINAAARVLRPRDGIAVVATISVSLAAGCGNSSQIAEAPAMQQDGGHEGGGSEGGVAVEAPSFDGGHPMETGPVVEAPAMPDSGNPDMGVIVEAPVMPDSGSAKG